ncbi:MAG: RDD family protein [Bryobacterales bacterium]|nr:RDD family protein [Bryobacterales bacterium]
MKCRYCGAITPPDEERCVKCQRLTVTVPPIHRSSAVPAAEPQFKETPPPPPKPQVVAGSGAVAARKPSQKPLFTSESPRVVAIAPPEPVRASAKPGRTRAPMPANQTSLDFGSPPPGRLLAKETDRSKWYPVAPRRLRAAAAVFDAGFIIGFCILFAASVRVTLGEMPWSLKTAPYWLAACVAVALLYKLAWAYAGVSSPGPRLSGLSLVSFDGYAPSLQQRICRQLFGFFSLAAGGMGLIWALCDQETLTWHDHMSQTFLTHAHAPRR